VLSVNCVHILAWGEIKFLEVPRGILCIIRSQSWDLAHFQKIFVGFCVLFEINHGILCIFGRSSWDFVHIWKFLMGFCAFLEVPRRIVHIWKFLMGLCTFYILWGTSKNAQNPMRNFQLGTKFHEDLPKMHKIPWLFGSS
jgi:hypothetical protein